MPLQLPSRDLRVHELQRHPVRFADTLRFGMLPVWPSEIRHRVVDVEGFGVLGVGVDFVDAVDADAGFQDQRDQLVLAQAKQRLQAFYGIGERSGVVLGEAEPAAPSCTCSGGSNGTIVVCP